MKFKNNRTPFVTTILGITSLVLLFCSCNHSNQEYEPAFPLGEFTVQ